MTNQVNISFDTPTRPSKSPEGAKCKNNTGMGIKKVDAKRPDIT
jgi:hypothetical protein